MLGLTDVELADVDVRLDYTAASLPAVERLVLDRFEIVDDVSFGEERPFLDGVTAYLGETLMRVAGGAWAWRAEGLDVEAFPRGVPEVRTDPALGLAPLVPVHLVSEAVRVRDGARFAALHDEWERAVRRLARTRPGWTPTKERTVLDPVPPTTDHLSTWLERQAAAFPDWVATHAPDGRWDFSADSLDALETVLRRVAADQEALDGPALRGFRDVAAWYHGEVMRRGLGGRWTFNERRRGRSLEYVADVGPWNSTCTPVVALENSYARPGYLRWQYDTFGN
jgi:hypothetical protein